MKYHKNGTIILSEAQRSFFGRFMVRYGIAQRIFVAAVVLVSIACSAGADIKHYSLEDVRVVAVHEHNQASFTEGYFFNGDVLCETGGYWSESAYYEDNVSRLKFGRSVFAEGSVCGLFGHST